MLREKPKVDKVQRVLHVFCGIWFFVALVAALACLWAHAYGPMLTDAVSAAAMLLAWQVTGDDYCG